MEAHSGAIRAPRGMPTRPRRRRIALFRERLRAHRRIAAARTQSINASRSLPGSVPGSEHTHLLPPKAY